MSKPRHDIVSVNDLLGTDLQFTIPTYQRGYSWDEINFAELWDDLINKSLKSEDLFLGSIILSQSSSSEDRQKYEIVDGQQRLITFTILIRAMHDLIAAETDQERFRRDLYRLIGSDDGSAFKLTLGKEDENFFYRYIKKLDRDSNLRGVKKSHKMIRVAYELFLENLNKEIASGRYNSGVEFLDSLFEAIKQKTQVLEIAVNDEFDAYAVFESINAKGVNLTPAELIKNYVFSTVSRNEAELSKVQEHWDDIIEKLSPLNKEIGVTNYLRHYWIATRADVREKELYRTIKTEFASQPSEVPSFVGKLAKNAGNYAAIVYPELIQTTEEGLSVLNIQKINRFNFKQTYPLLLASLIARVGQDELESLIESLESTIIRRSIRGSNPNELEERLSAFARSISENGASAISEIKMGLKSLTPTDDMIKEELKNSSYIPNTKVILEEYEISKSTGEKIILNPTLEHIMPQNPTDFGLWGVTMESYEHWLNNIGNLTLLGQPLNSSASNAEFSIKKGNTPIPNTRLLRNLLEITPGILSI